MPNEGSTSDLFQFRDYRGYLKNHFLERKKNRSGFSYSVWAKKLNLKSSSTLIMIVNGQRSPGVELVEKLEEYFRFSEHERNYFRDLIQFERSSTQPREHVFVADRILQSFKKKAYTVLTPNQFKLISSWHFLVLREFANLRDFRTRFHDYAWIKKRLRFEVSELEIRRSISILKGMGILKGHGDLAPQTINTQYDIGDEAIRSFHEQSLENARKSVRKIDIDKREFMSFVFAMNEKNLPQAKTLIRNFQKQFMELLEETDADQIYQMNMSFCPVTQSLKESSDEK